MNYYRLADKVLAGDVITAEEGLEVIRAPDSDLKDILDAAQEVRRYHHGNAIKLHVLLNAKSGICSEDCGFCSQSSISKANISKYRLLASEQIVEAAKRAKKSHAWKFCIVIASRGPDGHDMDVICKAVKEIKETVKVNVCTSLGILNLDQAKMLKEAGVDRFNHNLETSPRYFPKICSTHTYQDRLNTIDYCKKVCMGTCSGGIAGMGETDEDIVDLAFECKRLDIDSIPVNFLNPIDGTPLGSNRNLTPQKCLGILALFRFVNPTKDIRVAGGREYNLRDMQPLALKVVNSMFTDGYLTTPGKSFKEDCKMVLEQGCEILEP